AQAKANLGLLDPSYRQLIESNPGSFDPSTLPSAIRALLEEFRPTSTDVNVGTSFRLNSRLTVTPNLGRSVLSQGPTSHDGVWNVGYSMNYRLSQTLQLQSSLSVMNSATGERHARVLTVGVSKTLSGSPKLLTPSKDLLVEGHVYRDMNVNGDYNA